jgi:hypothetical protein
MTELCGGRSWLSGTWVNTVSPGCRAARDRKRRFTPHSKRFAEREHARARSGGAGDSAEAREIVLRGESTGSETWS